MALVGGKICVGTRKLGSTSIQGSGLDSGCMEEKSTRVLLGIGSLEEGILLDPDP